MPKGDIGKGNKESLEVVMSSVEVNDMKVGDAVVLVGNYDCALSQDLSKPIFGQVAKINPGTGEIDVRYVGLCQFTYDGEPPRVDGRLGVELSTEPGFAGRVTRPNVGAGKGIVVAVDTDANTVDVLL